MRGAVVAVEGPSGAGKSRAVAGAARRLDAVVLAEAYDRLRPPPPLVWRGPAELLRLERRLLREEARRYREARALAAGGRLVLADTGFLGPLTYVLGLATLRRAPPAVLDALRRDAAALAADGRWGTPDAVVYLQTPERERTRRAAGDPRGHPAALRARHRAVGRVERRFYRTRLAPRYGRRWRVVSGRGPPAAVATRVARAARRVAAAAARRRPPAPGPLLRALGPRAGRSETSPIRA